MRSNFHCQMDKCELRGLTPTFKGEGGLSYNYSNLTMGTMVGYEVSLPMGITYNSHSRKEAYTDTLVNEGEIIYLILYHEVQLLCFSPQDVEGWSGICSQFSENYLDFIVTNYLERI